MIAVVDYGVGNLFSLCAGLDALGLAHRVTGDAAEIRAAERIILPGVGAFGDAMQSLQNTGLIPVLKECAQRTPLLGICLGMQLLFDQSEEYGRHTGLGLIPGRVAPLRPALTDPSLKVPHMGWNRLDIVKPDPLLRDTRDGTYVYYVHSFYAVDCADSTLATSDYSVPVPGVVRRGPVCGCQFHPEKSGADGLKILKAFAELPPA